MELLPDGPRAIEIVNLTPHEVNVMRSASEMQSFPPSGTVARLIEKSEPGEAIISGMAYGSSPIQTRYITYGVIANLPDPKEDTLYIVSALVGPIAAQLGRHDCIAPDTGRAIRDEKGSILGVPGFVRY